MPVDNRRVAPGSVLLGFVLAVPVGFKRITIILSITVLMSGLFPRSAPAGSAPEYDVKAAFIFNFAKFVEWPEGTFQDPESPVVLCVYGGSPVRTAFGAIRGKRVKGREIVVRLNENIGDIKECNIIFFSSSDKRHTAQALESIKGMSILTVGEAPEFIRYGGMINFTSHEDKVRFEINQQVAKRGGIAVSSQLLKLADTTRGR